MIEKAKGLLMKRTGLDEHEAFRRLQRLASERNRKLVDIATIVLTADEAFQPIDDAREKDRGDHRRTPRVKHGSCPCRIAQGRSEILPELARNGLPAPLY